MERDSTTGAITRFQDYNSQMPAKHDEGDDGSKHKAEWAKALAAATELLKFLKAGTPAATVRQWLLAAASDCTSMAARVERFCQAKTNVSTWASSLLWFGW